MAHDGFLGGFHELSWPLPHATAAAADAAPLDPLRVHVPDAFMGADDAGWEHDVLLGALVPSQSQSPSPSSVAAAAAATLGGGGDAVEVALMEQLASRFGVSVPSPPPSSRYTSFHCTPVGSPSKPVAPRVLAGNAVLAGRTATLSCFPASGGQLSRVASSQSLLGEQAPTPAPPLPAGAVRHNESDESCNDGPCRKRKPASGGKSKAKDVVVATATPKSREPERKAKKCKLSTDATAHDEQQKSAAREEPAAGEEAWHGNGNGKGKEVAAEPPKDYIHVRARRGQATDSHSLAERVRREKISERMKLLQDLVPGCCKVTGKAVMLDEIINYVQSLQRQVEFLSMKLSTVNPRLELDADSFIPKDANNKLCAPVTTSAIAQPLPPVYALEGSNSAFCYSSCPGTAAATQSVVTNAKGFAFPSSFVNHGIPNRSLEEGLNPQTGSLWEEDDLQSLVLMGFRGNT